jgi:hypothetical protein
MGKTMVSRTLSVHKEHELLLKLETAGLNDELAQRVIDSKGNDLATKVVRLIQHRGRGFEDTTSLKRARLIMYVGNFFGIEDAIEYFGVKPTEKQLENLWEIPFSESVLEMTRATHILVAVFPLSILEIRDRVKEELFAQHEDTWYNTGPVGKERGEASWQLVCRTPVENSTSKNWKEQQALLGEEDEVADVRVLVYTIIGHYLATGERLFKDISCVRTSFSRNPLMDWHDALYPPLDSVIVGFFNSPSLTLGFPQEDIGLSYLGLASVRKKWK